MHSNAALRQNDPRREFPTITRSTFLFCKDGGGHRFTCFLDQAKDGQGMETCAECGTSWQNWFVMPTSPYYEFFNHEGR